MFGQVSDKGYKDGPTPEGMWACVIGGLVGAPIFMILLVGHTLGDCVEEIGCKPSGFVNVV